MSMERSHTANLPGFGSPVYPGLLTKLVEAFTRHSPSGMGGAPFEEAARSCPGFVSVREGVRTADGYTWWRGVTFNVAGGQVIILMPRVEDTSIRDGTRLDRSPAVYVKGQQARQNLQATANAIVARLGRALGNVGRRS